MEVIREKNHLRLIRTSGQPAPAMAKARRPAPAPRSPNAYFKRIESYAQRIRQTDSVMAIIDILDQALTETRALEHGIDRQLTSGNITQAEREIQLLKTEVEQLRGLVHVDHLTGLLNRGGLDDTYAREAARADRAGKSLAVALLDVDDFKSLNDRHGHQAGDEALAHLARVMRKAMRPSDILVRFGGEEFLFLLPDVNEEQAAQALLRLQLDLDRQPLSYADHEIALTFSAGIAIRAPRESRDAVIARADAAMYAAKRSGKRKICKATDLAQALPH